MLQHQQRLRRGRGDGVIHEVDAALRALVEGEALGGPEVEVAFDAPTRDWAARRSAPTVNLYLYDIREDVRRRQNGLINEYDERGAVIARHQPARHFRLAYLVTAWTQRPEDEHRLLSSVLACLLCHDKLPDDVLPEGLRSLGMQLPVTIAEPPNDGRSSSELWSALGGELKPSLDIVVTTPTAAPHLLSVAGAVTTPLQIDLKKLQADAPLEGGGP
jgi:hypothetical protein